MSVGLNADGQLGNGSTTSRSTPGLVDLPATIVQIASGREHAYALDDQARIWAWGDNSKRAVGDGTSTDRRTPVRLSLTNVAEVEAGHYHGIARRSDGTVWTWGYGSLGQLGLGTTNNRSVPTQVPGIDDAIAVAAGRDMSYVIRANGTMLAFGRNSEGEVGDGTTTRRLSPVAVSGMTGAAAVSAGRDHALVVRTNGSLWTWGANSRGQLGIGSTAYRTTPVEVLSGSVLHADAGAEHSIAVLANGTVRTWGRGQRGQLGLGTTSNRSTPTAVPGLSGIVEVGDGRDQSFAMNAAGTVWAWGHNDSGQLGDGTTTTRLSPVQISGLTGITTAQGGRGMTIFLTGDGGPGPDPDTTPPTAPGKPNATSTTAGRVDLSWGAATDDRATQLAYSVYRDGGSNPIGSVVGGVTGAISFADTGRTPGASHTYRVRASDGANSGPLSVASDPVVVAGGGGGGGGDPTVLLESDFSNGLSGWSVNGSVTADASQGSGSAPSIRVAVAGARADARRSWSGSPDAVCAAVDVRVASMSGSYWYTLVRLRSSTGSSVARVEVNRWRGLSVRVDTTGTRLSVSPRLTFNAWSELTLCVSNGASGAITLLLDGIEVGSWTANTGTRAITQIQLGDSSTRTATVNWDDLVVTADA
jgi:alpha-tubulin suppressor-like RCC1 family protein